MKHKFLFPIYLVLYLSCQDQLPLPEGSRPSFIVTKSSSESAELRQINKPITYLADTDFTAWTNIKGLANRFKACEIQMDTLSRMTTESLMKSILHFPLNYSILFYDDILSGVKLISHKSSLHQEFASRADAPSVLASFFCSTVIDKAKKVDTRDNDYINLTVEDRLFLEYYMCSNQIIHQLTRSAKDSLINNVEKLLEDRLLDNDLSSEISLRPLYLIDKSLRDGSEDQEENECMSRSYSITVRTPFDKPLSCYHYDEMTQYWIGRYNDDAVSEHPDATFISSSTNNYNCHSYAWYDNSTSNTAWMNSYYSSSFQLSKYWTNDVYVECDDDSDATRVYYESDPWTSDHSAIRLPSGKFRSKWGSGPVMEHDWNDVPQEYLDSLVTLRYFKVRSTPLVNVYTFVGDNLVFPNTDHDYYSTSPSGLTNVWSAEYLNYPDQNPFVFSYYSSANGGTYRMNCQEFGAYKIYIDGYYEGNHVAWGEKLVVCVGARKK